MELSERRSERYLRQIALKEVGVDGQKRLQQAKVLVIGAGGLGSAALPYLAAAGVGTLGVADHDRVDASNLARQVIHKTASVGEPKLVSAERALKELNPEITIVRHGERMTAENIMSAISPYDIVLDCTDRFETKFLINDACVLAGKPYVHAGVVRFGGQVMTYIPGRGPCLRCLLGGVPSVQDAPTCAQVGVMGAAVGVIGSLQALEAIKYLLGVGRPLAGKILQFDGLEMRVRVTDAPHADPGCRVCGTAPDILSIAENAAEYAV